MRVHLVGHMVQQKLEKPERRPRVPHVRRRCRRSHRCRRPTRRRHSCRHCRRRGCPPLSPHKEARQRQRQHHVHIRLGDGQPCRVGTHQPQPRATQPRLPQQDGLQAPNRTSDGGGRLFRRPMEMQGLVQRRLQLLGVGARREGRRGGRRRRRPKRRRSAGGGARLSRRCRRRPRGTCGGLASQCSRAGGRPAKGQRWRGGPSGRRHCRRGVRHQRAPHRRGGCQSCRWGGRS